VEIISNAAAGTLVQGVFRCGPAARQRRKPAVHGRGIWTFDRERQVRRHDNFSERFRAKIKQVARRTRSRSNNSKKLSAAGRWLMGSVHYDGRDNIREGLTHERQSYSQAPPALPNWRSVFYDRRLFCDIQYRSAFCSLSDLPSKFHPAAVRVSGLCTPCGAVGATGDWRSWSGLRSRSSVAVNVAA
jgi:hypothetical protein